MGNKEKKAAMGNWGHPRPWLKRQTSKKLRRAPRGGWK